jgi:hypothetical protein
MGDANRSRLCESPNFTRVIKTRTPLEIRITRSSLSSTCYISTLLHISLLPVISLVSVAHTLLRAINDVYVAGSRLQRCTEVSTVVSDTIDTTLTRAAYIAKYLVDVRRHISGSRVLGSAGLSTSTGGGIVVVVIVAAMRVVLVVDFWDARILTPLRHEQAVVFCHD